MSRLTLGSLHVYPIKSLRGVSAPSWRVDRRGFALDRRWMLVDDEGRFLSQRVLPRMALIDVEVLADHLRVSAPGMPPASVPFVATGPRRRVVIWDDTCDAVEVPEVTGWFREALGAACTLVDMPDDAERQVDPAFAKPGEIVGFSDGFPFLLLTTASLEALNARLPSAVGMDRFRPNLVVLGATPFEEDAWETIAIGGLSFRVVKPCARCVIPNVDPRTAEKGAEPLRTLATFRKEGNGVMFGQNLIHEGEGGIAEGARVTVGKRG